MGIKQVRLGRFRHFCAATLNSELQGIVPIVYQLLTEMTLIIKYKLRTGVVVHLTHQFGVNTELRTNTKVPLGHL